MRTGTRRRRAWLGAFLGAAAAMAFASPANAVLTPSTDVTMDGDVHWWNGSNVLSHGNYQFAAYWDAPDGSGNVYAKITRRNLTSGALESIIFDGSGSGSSRTSAERNRNINDGHDYLQIGLSPKDGRVHISWSPHHDDHHYGMSGSSCITQTTFNQANCRFDWTRFMTGETDVDNGGNTVDTESILTYPYYFNDNDGDLYFAYRFGESFRGTTYLNSYNNNGTWTSRGRLFWGRRNAGDTIRFPEGTAEQRGVYHYGFAFDKNDTLHVMWNWKEYITEAAYFMRGLYYAYSRNHGRDWYNTAGTRVATIESRPFLSSNDTDVEVLSVPFGSWQSLADIELDSNNRPHVVVGMSDVLTDDMFAANMRTRHIWLGSDNRWYSSWATDARGDTGVGDLIFDGADSAYFVYKTETTDWYPYFGPAGGGYAMNELAYENVTWQSDGSGGGYLDVQQKSDVTCLDSGDLIDTAISSTGNNRLRVMLNNNTDATTMNVWFTTEAEPTWDGTDRMRTIGIADNAGSNWQPLTLDFSGTPDWDGTLRNLEICLNDSRADRGDQFKIDFIRVTDRNANAAKSWEFDTMSGEMRQIAVAARDNWSYGNPWTREELAPGVTNTIKDGGFLIDKQRYKDSRKVSFLMQVQGAPGTESLSLREFDVSGDVTRKQWLFDLNETDWTRLTDLSSFGWSAGAITGTLSGNDSAILSADNLSVPVSRTDKIWIYMRNDTTARVGRVWFVTDASSSWNSARSRDFSLVARGGGYAWHEIDVSSLSGWNGGTLRQLRIDPANETGVSTGSFAIESIYVGE